MPIIDDGTTQHEQKTISIYSNDGTSLLYSNRDWYTGYNIEVTETGLAHTEGFDNSYDHGKSILGFATSANATEPIYAVGDTFQISADTTLYVIEAKSSGVTVEYNGSVVVTIPNGNTATLPIASKKMKTDIVITVPSGSGGGGGESGGGTVADSAIPPQVSTEAEMTALLTSGEVGGVYKYTGTTGTYENGALYLLETSGFNLTLSGSYSTSGVAGQIMYVKLNSQPTSDSDYDYDSKTLYENGSVTVQASSYWRWTSNEDYTTAIEVVLTEDKSAELGYIVHTGGSND